MLIWSKVLCNFRRLCTDDECDWVYENMALTGNKSATLTCYNLYRFAIENFILH